MTNNEKEQQDMNSESATEVAKAAQLAFLTPVPAVSKYFKYEDVLPVYIAGDDYCVDAWCAINAKTKRWSWCKAAIAAHLEPANGRRTDRGQGPTAKQQFCKAVDIRPERCSRLARTYATFENLLLDPGGKKLVAELLVDDHFEFKHFYVAAHYAGDPIGALLAARDEKLSANALERQLALDDSPDGYFLVIADDDDDDPHVTCPPTRRPSTHKKAPQRMATRKVRIVGELSIEEFHDFRCEMRGLANVYGTRDDWPTVRRAVKVAWALAEREAASIPADSGGRDECSVSVLQHRDDGRPVVVAHRGAVPSAGAESAA
jgi:hypothetical protein